MEPVLITCLDCMETWETGWSGPLGVWDERREDDACPFCGSLGPVLIEADDGDEPVISAQGEGT